MSTSPGRPQRAHQHRGGENAKFRSQKEKIPNGWKLLSGDIAPTPEIWLFVRVS